MPRPRSTNKSGKGSSSSFGKRTDAEKSFRKKDSAPRGAGFPPKRSFGKPSGFKKSFGASGDHPESDKPKRSFSSSRPDRREERGDRDNAGSRPWRAEAGKRPFKKNDGAGAGRFQKKSSQPERDAKVERDGQRPFKREGAVSRDDFKRVGTSREVGPKKPFREKDDFVKKPGGDFRSHQDKKSFGSKERKSFIQSRVTSADFTKPSRKPAAAEVSAESTSSDGLIRLNKYVANSGVGSRREADKLIQMGLISVNGVAVTELGTKVKRTDVVRYEDKILKAEKPVYILLNKPKGFITTTDDPEERSTVMGLVAGACKERIYPVGRLDRNTTGLLLLTNDGDLADKLTHPSYKAKKVYKVELDKPLTKNDLQKIVDGVRLEEGRAMVDDIAIISEDKKSVGLEIHIGWNRVVRRIFETLGYQVVKLDRSVYAGLDKKDTPRGHWRFLKSEEIIALKHFK